MDKLASVYKRFKKSNGFKWTQIIKFRSFKDIMASIKKRENEQLEEDQIVSSISISPVSKNFDRSQLVMKSLSIINPSSVPSLSVNKSVKNIIHDKTEHRLRAVDKNFIIHSHDFEEADKIYQFVMSQKNNNWQRVVYEDKNSAQLAELAKQIEEHEKLGAKETQNNQYMKIINAKTLYIITYEGDTETNEIESSLPNNFHNRYLLSYQNENELSNLLNLYARDDDNFIILIIYQQGSSEDMLVKNFLDKNKNASDF
jgi:hypothetical protein